METFYKSTSWKILLIILVLANMATLLAFWFARLQNDRQQRANDPRENASEFIIKELKLNQRQIAAFKQLRDRHRESVDAINEQIREDKDQFFSRASDPSPGNRPAAAVLSAQIGKEEASIDLLTLTHFQQVRALCTPAQQVKFDQIIHDLLRMMAPQQGPGPQGQPPPGDIKEQQLHGKGDKFQKKDGPHDHRFPPPPGGKMPPPPGEGPQQEGFPPPPGGDHGEKPPPPPVK